MLKWFRSRRGESKEATVPQPEPDDSGEDVYETEEELDREADPVSKMPRIKTNDI